MKVAGEATMAKKIKIVIETDQRRESDEGRRDTPFKRKFSEAGRGKRFVQPIHLLSILPTEPPPAKRTKFTVTIHTEGRI